MHSQYEPREHIQHLDVAPRAEGILDQREITIHSYQTTVPFDYGALDAGLEAAWLTPQIRLGVFSRSHLVGKDALTVVLGLQDELSVRAYDYDNRRPLWYSWQDVIVDTVNIHYFRDEDGLLRFTTTGGGRRITDERLHDFNSAFLGIPKGAVSKRHFDLEKLRELCFDRFIDRLYMLRFSDPSGDEYRSIDHALFQSRQYIDPKAERLHEIHADTQVKVESFDSDIDVRAKDLASSIRVRFFIRGLSGALRLRFPKISYKNDPATSREQAAVFYRVVDATVSSILDSDYYTQQRRLLEELDTNVGMFPDMVDLTPFREALTSGDAREEFISDLDIAAPWQKWLPHLRALDELALSEVVVAHVADLMGELAKRDPKTAVRLLAACQNDAKMHRVGAVVAGSLAAELQGIQGEMRAQVEGSLLSWAVDCEEEAWDLDPQTDEIGVLNLRWRIEDLSLDVLPSVLWKLVGVLHARLTTSNGETGALLERFSWCMTAAKALPPNHSKNPMALRLVAACRVPQSVVDGAKVLKEPVGDLRALDDAVLAQYGLPLWPLLAASRSEGRAVLSNMGIGAAIGVVARPTGVLLGDDGQPSTTDLIPDGSISFSVPDDVITVEVEFEKFGRRYQQTLSLVGEVLSAVSADNVRVLPAAISQKRRVAQRKYREAIDPQGIVVGTSSGMLEVFEDIHYANAMDGCPAVLILGEPGVGKTHIAQLLHDSSTRSSEDFRTVNAGGGGGDINIQRGEWIGYGEGHGIQGVDGKGRPGHLMNVDGGTLFVDEFATMSQDLQVVFLSVLEDRAIEKIGGEPVTPNVRCIFATNADIDDAVAAGTLRRDLVDRIGITFRIPPLRDRRGDILILAKHFAADHGVTDRCLVAILRHNWPGNVRELQKLIQRAAAHKTSDDAATIDLEHIDLPPEIIAAVETIDADACRRELWHLADKVARDEGLSPGAGLQRRAGEIMGVGESQACKMYRKHGLSTATTA